jgi:hypothetical protein
MPAAAVSAEATPEDEACGALFKGLTFFLPREVRLSLPLHSTPLRWVLV